MALMAAAESPAVGAAPGRGQQAAFRSEVRIALHGVAVLDATGRPVTDLAGHEFQIYEDGEPQTIELFLAPNETPIDVALILDTSSSLAPWAATVRRAADTFLRSMEPRDCAFLLPFNDAVGPGLWARPFDPDLGRRIDGLFLEGSTALYDAVYEGLEALEAAKTPAAAGGAMMPDPRPEDAAAGPRDTAVALPTPQSSRSSAICGVAHANVNAPGQPQRRRAIVLLSDGEDVGSARRFDEVLELARTASIPIFPVVLGGARDNPRLHAVLDALAGNTGGTIVETDSAEQLRAAFEDIEALLHASYLLGYVPSGGDDPGAWHEIEIRSRRPSYRLVHREGYFR